jgi:LPS O-antigen subunit length determinant protein (WzzB/FepE family)
MTQNAMHKEPDLGSVMNNSNQLVVAGDRDEIDLLDLIKSIWSQRGLVLGSMLVAVLAVLSFHFSKASFSTVSRIDYPITLSFLTDNKLS